MLVANASTLPRLHRLFLCMCKVHCLHERIWKHSILYDIISWENWHASCNCYCDTRLSHSVEHFSIMQAYELGLSCRCTLTVMCLACHHKPTTVEQHSVLEVDLKAHVSIHVCMNASTWFIINPEGTTLSRCTIQFEGKEMLTGISVKGRIPFDIQQKGVIPISTV